MDATIRLGDLGIALLGAALLTLIVYGIFVLKNLNDTLRVVRKIVEDNESNIRRVMDKAPVIAEHMESISGDISHDVRAAQGTLEHLLGTTEAAAGVLSENTDVLTGLVGIIQVIAIAKEFFGSLTRKRKWF